MKGFHALNQSATIVFCELIERLRHSVENFNCGHLKIPNEPHLPLSLEQFGSGVRTFMGKGFQYRLAQSYLQVGDLIHEPEMTFLVIDHRNHPEDYAYITILAMTYRHDTLGLSHRSSFIRDNQLTIRNEPLSQHLASLANDWMMTIQAQGFPQTDWYDPEKA